ncbi:hypothetical protein, partial [Pilimelia anulata]|uniref:hypothetical protein n=1 Tax=Pilimelia anulata TaxID=53371 RepID=UPI001E562F46
CMLDDVTLPDTGTYKITLDPQAAATASLTARLHAPAAVTGTLTAGGSPSRLTIAEPGQDGTWTFTGTAGQKVFVDFTDGTFAEAANAHIYKPDGSHLTGVGCSTTCRIDATTLPASGTYKINLNPPGLTTGGLTAKLSNVPDPVAGTLTAGGPASTLTTTAPGQNGEWTFTGTAGQR